MEGAKTAPIDEAGSCHLAGTVYGGRIPPLPAKRHPRQQRDHLQRPAQIAEIMHFPPRPPLHARAADPGVMHAVQTVFLSADQGWLRVREFSLGASTCPANSFSLYSGFQSLGA